MGLISLRGQIVPLIDLRKRLGMDTSQPIQHPYHVVVNTAYAIASFEVDEIGEVIDVPAPEFIPPPDSVKAMPTCLPRSLSSDAERERGKQVGIDSYQIKLRREVLMKEVFRLLGSSKALN